MNTAAMQAQARAAIEQMLRDGQGGRLSGVVYEALLAGLRARGGAPGANEQLRSAQAALAAEIKAGGSKNGKVQSPKKSQQGSL